MVNLLKMLGRGGAHTRHEIHIARQRDAFDDVRVVHQRFGQVVDIARVLGLNADDRLKAAVELGGIKLDGVLLDYAGALQLANALSDRRNGHPHKLGDFRGAHARVFRQAGENNGIDLIHGNLHKEVTV